MTEKTTVRKFELILIPILTAVAAIHAAVGDVTPEQ